MTRRLALMLVMLAIVGAACREAKVSTAVPEPLKQERTLQYELTITGDTPGRFEGKTPVTTVTLDDDRFPQFRWFGLENKQWVEIGEGWRAFLSLNVFGFEGEGSYVVPVSQLDQNAPAPSGGGQALSNVRLRVVRGTGEDAPSRTYGIVVKPCDVTLEKNGDVGELRCSRLRDPGGPHVSMVLRWSVE